MIEPWMVGVALLGIAFAGVTWLDEAQKRRARRYVERRFGKAD